MARRRTATAVGLAALVLFAFAWTARPDAAEQARARRPVGVPKSTPDTPFKLMTFDVAGSDHVGMVLGTRVVDLDGAARHVAGQFRLEAMAMPRDMKGLIERYDTLKPRLYQVANYFAQRTTAGLPFAYDVSAVTVRAPIKYPWNLMAASANYKAHAQGMGEAGAGQGSAPPAAGARPAAGFDASAADRIVPDRDAPIVARSGHITSRQIT